MSRIDRFGQPCGGVFGSAIFVSGTLGLLSVVAPMLGGGIAQAAPAVVAADDDDAAPPSRRTNTTPSTGATTRPAAKSPASKTGGASAAASDDVPVGTSPSNKASSGSAPGGINKSATNKSPTAKAPLAKPAAAPGTIASDDDIPSTTTQPAVKSTPNSASKPAASVASKPTNKTAAKTPRLGSAGNPSNPGTVTSDSATSESDSASELPVKSDPASGAQTKPGNTKITIESSSLKGIEPGVATVDDLKREWGDEKEKTKADDGDLYVYEFPGFKRVEAYVVGGKVNYLILKFARSFPNTEVAKQLKFDGIVPVSIIDDHGSAMGEAYPERGVVFSYDVPGKSTAVSQVLLEGINAESFVLRAESKWRMRPTASLADVDFALTHNRQNHRAHWVRAQILAAASRYPEAKQAADEALRLKSDHAPYVLLKAMVTARTGDHETALRTTQEVVASADLAPQDKARALCQLGDLLAGGPQRDYKQAVGSYSKAIEMAEPLSKNPLASVRREAKLVLLDAHLGAAQCIAWGNWNKKEQVVPKWLDRAKEVADDLVKYERGERIHQFTCARRSVAALATLRGKLDIARPMQEIGGMAKLLTDEAADPLLASQSNWQLALVQFDALQASHGREQAARAVTHGKQGLVHLKLSAKGREPTPEEEYLAGQLLFRIGAVHAILENKHAEAVNWYAQAIPILEKPTPPSDLVDPVQHAEAFVSMGVSYWQTGQKARAVELTAEGVHLYEQAVEAGLLDPAQLEIPYNNMANMHGELGNAEKSKAYSEMASKVKADSTKKQ